MIKEFEEELDTSEEEEDVDTSEEEDVDTSEEEDVDTSEEEDVDTSEEEEEDVDTSWIDDFKKDNEKYSEFYTEEVTNITLFFIYIDHKNNIENLSRDLLILDRKNTIFRDQLIQLIKQNQIQNQIQNNNNKYKYKLFSLLKYNIDIEPEEIYNFINNKEDYSFNKRFFIQEKYLNDIIYKNTINIFQDLNSLFFIFKETNPIVNNNINNNNNNINNNNNNINNNKKSTTKKTIVFSQKHKTRRRKN
jgi:hypothetical protein